MSARDTHCTYWGCILASEPYVRETQLTGRSRSEKIALVEQANPLWQGLAENWNYRSLDSLRCPE